MLARLYLTIFWPYQYLRSQKLISNSRHLEGSNSVGHFEIGCLSQEKTGSEIWVYYGEYSLTEICKTSLETLYKHGNWKFLVLKNEYLGTI